MLFQGVLGCSFLNRSCHSQEAPRSVGKRRNTSCLLNNTVTKGQASLPNKRLIPLPFWISVQTQQGGEIHQGRISGQCYCSLPVQMNSSFKKNIIYFIRNRSKDLEQCERGITLIHSVLWFFQLILLGPTYRSSDKPNVRYTVAAGVAQNGAKKSEY